MSLTRKPDAAPSTRQVHQLVRGTAASLAGKRRTHQPVRRHSYDRDDRAQQPWRPIGDGTKKGGLDWVEAMLKTAREWHLQCKEPGQRGPLPPYTTEVLRVLLTYPDFQTGRLEPALETIARKAPGQEYGGARPRTPEAAWLPGLDTADREDRC